MNFTFTYLTHEWSRFWLGILQKAYIISAKTKQTEGLVLPGTADDELDRPLAFCELTLGLRIEATGI
jgi:hypothetical protein